MAILELKNTTTYKTRLGDLDGKGASADVVVGGSDPSKFIPNINISRWDNEVFLNLNFGKSIVTNEKHLFSDGKVSINVGGIDHTQYIKDKKNSEWELSFAERPDCESFEFDMVHSDSLSFYFMPPLEDQYARDTEGMTWEEYQKLYTVDPKAVGGYTVYHNKRNNKYKAGKFLTIWPPWFIDAHGDRKKGIVKVNEEKKQLIITCDKLWLDNAAYPVVLDPTIGYTSVGTYGNIAATYSYTWAGNTYNATEDGTMSKLFIGRNDAGETTSLTEWAGCIYEGFIAGDDLLGYSTKSGSVPADDDWASINLTEGTLTVTDTNPYCAGFHGDNTLQWAFDAGAVNQTYRKVYYSWASDPPFDDVLSGNIERRTYRLPSCYMEYGAAGTAYERSIAGIMGALAGGLDRSFTAKRKPLGSLAEPSGVISRAASLSRKIQGEI